MFGRFRKRKRRELADAAFAARQVEIATDSLKLIRSTLEPKTFFGRCDDIAAVEEQLTGTSAFRDDIPMQTALQIELIDRVIAAGRADTFRTSMADYEWRLTPDAMLHYAMKIDD